MRSQSGQATVELALSLTVLIFLLFGMVDFGRVFYAYLVMDHAGREAARAASLGDTDTEIDQVVQANTDTLTDSTVSIAITPDQSQRVSGSYVTVTLNSSIPILTPIMASILANPFPITTKTVMRVE
ncbi:pilus assembly protein [Fodinisporobacter ferrooxydans]|uniref:Pilus assembly protein n=1 Tax=Fodinisporobacter ferrooxydans TaxID=2901836 RepID=A0ABY4CP18_9BACL|nr:pilus assembly protein [Alicyclobacillaceae bacterium MYW30-H2]